MKTAVRTPTNAVTAKATVGKGAVSPKFCENRKKGIIQELKKKKKKQKNLGAIIIAKFLIVWFFNFKM